MIFNLTYLINELLGTFTYKITTFVKYKHFTTNNNCPSEAHRLISCLDNQTSADVTVN